MGAWPHRRLGFDRPPLSSARPLPGHTEPPASALAAVINNSPGPDQEYEGCLGDLEVLGMSPEPLPLQVSAAAAGCHGRVQ